MQRAQTARGGQLAPEFTATTSEGRVVSLSDFKNKQAVVLFFYPRDNSLVCTREACAFRDAYSDLVGMGAAVIGVSGDSDDSHRSFAGSHRLQYDLISDKDGRLRELYGVRNTFFLLPARVTFVIDKDGLIRHVFRSLLSGARHVEEALKALREISNP